MSSAAAERSHVTTHVLDSVTGRPAAGVSVSLEQFTGTAWVSVATGETDADGRLAALGPALLAAGRYRIIFDTETWFAGLGRYTFYPEVTITFDLADAAEHYHVPLLLSPFAYSTYRGN